MPCSATRKKKKKLLKKVFACSLGYALLDFTALVKQACLCIYHNDILFATKKKNAEVLRERSRIPASCIILSCSIWDLVPWPGIEPRPPAVKAGSLSHWTTRELPWVSPFYRQVSIQAGPPSQRRYLRGFLPKVFALNPFQEAAHWVIFLNDQVLSSSA